MPGLVECNIHITRSDTPSPLRLQYLVAALSKLRSLRSLALCDSTIVEDSTPPPPDSRMTAELAVSLSALTNFQLHISNYDGQLAPIVREFGWMAVLTHLQQLDLLLDFELHPADADLSPISHLRQLRSLSTAVICLYHQAFLHLPMWLSELTNLCVLEWGRLTIIPFEITSTTSSCSCSSSSSSNMQSTSPLSALTGLRQCSISNLCLASKSSTQLDITSLTRLSSLRLHDCIIGGAVSCQMLHAMSQLVSLELLRTTVGSLPSSLSALIHLTELNIRHGSLCSLPSAVWCLPSLAILDVRRNKITILEEATPAVSGGAAPVRKLNLSFNSLQQLPSLLTRLVTLDTLTADSNELQALPNGMSMLTRLTSLRLDYNKLTSLPEYPPEVSYAGQGSSDPLFSRLQFLGLAGNAIDGIPNWVWSLPALQHLICNQNRLKVLPEIPDRLTPVLQHLNVSLNCLQQLPVIVVMLKAALKLRFPTQVLLLRGNHDVRMHLWRAT